MTLPRRSLHLSMAVVTTAILVLGASGGSTRAQAANPTHRVFAFNDLGMHCYDSDFSVFSILPLFNVVHAQVLRVGTTPTLLGPSGVRVTYRAMADGTGSMNSTSARKTNFWRYLNPLFGVTRPVDTGILGARMPGSRNRPRLFPAYASSPGWFEVRGVPITLRDDNGKRNPYPLMRVSAVSQTTGAALASLPTVLPASDEMACGSCHLTGRVAAADPGVTWSVNPILSRQYKENILLLHDFSEGTTLFAAQPVLCASCHYSLALDLGETGPSGGQVGNPTMSRAVHGFHGSRIAQDPGGVGTCFLCHPGRRTQCLRGAMSASGIGCVDCHGTMTAVGAKAAPWANEPKCQSCHTGDALANFDGQIVRRTAYTDSPDVATPIVAANTRFAEQPDTLYRNSVGHGGLACESCHGSPHAEWPSREKNDNLAAVAIQGYKGVVGECTACHGAAGPPLGLNGPHGLHAVNSPSWIDTHHSYYESAPADCQTCHGLQGAGTVISRAMTTRTFAVEDIGTVRIYGGTKIGCGNCHENPFLGGGD